MTSSIDHLHKPVRELTNIFGEPIPKQDDWLSWSQEKRDEYESELKEELCFDSDEPHSSHVYDWMEVCAFANHSECPEFIREKASQKHPMHNASTLEDTLFYLNTRVPEALEGYLVAESSDHQACRKILKKYNFIHEAVVKLGDAESPIYIYPTQRDGMTRVEFTRNRWRSHKHEDTYTTFYYLVPREELIPIYERAKVVQGRREALLKQW